MPQKSFKAILVGDVHCTEDAIVDCAELVKYIISKATQNECNTVFFLGDLFHTHSTINSYVLDFWKKAFDNLLKQGYIVYAIPGNHDSAGAGIDDGPHSLSAFVGYNTNLRIIDKPTEIFENVWAIPHLYDRDKFLSAVNNIRRPSTIFCHQTFDGCQYENGFYAKDGINVSKTDHLFISGHIHLKQEWGNVKYVGSSRWLNVNDANQAKAIYYIEFIGGVIQKWLEFDIASVVTPIYTFDDTPELPAIEPKSNLLKQKARVVINIRGPESFINSRLIYYKALKSVVVPTFSLRTFPTKENITEIKESEGIGKAFKQFFMGFEPKFGTDKEILLKVVQERCSFLIK